MDIAVVGATGQVGGVMRAILHERSFPVGNIRFLASARSAGTTLEWAGRDVVVEDTATADWAGIGIALLSAGRTASMEYAPKIVAAGAMVIDNSSGWRMDPDVPLVVPEVNAAALDDIPLGIVANPNCTTMVAMPVLAPLHAEAGLRSLTIATYQAVSGAGLAGVDELASQVASVLGNAKDLRWTFQSHPRSRGRSPSTSCPRPGPSWMTAWARPTRNRSSATRVARSWASPT
jgi:aspartate-semialdehyde dehydrogenase